MRRLTKGAGVILLIALLVFAFRAIRVESERFRIERVAETEMPPSLAPGTVALTSLVPAGRLIVGDVIVYRHPAKPSERVYLRIGEISRIPRSTGYLIRLDSGDAGREAWHTELYGLAWRVEASVLPPAFLADLVPGSAPGVAAGDGAGAAIVVGGALTVAVFTALAAGGWYRWRPARIGRSYRPDLW